jgi:hypothetical protein
MDLGINWLYFVNERVPSEEFEPVPDTRSRMEWNDSLGAEWESWKSETLRALTATADRGSGHRLGLDPPDFPSLAAFPSLRRRCVQRWDGYAAWTRTEARHIDRGLAGLYPRENTRNIRERIPDGTTVTLTVVSMSTRRVLESEESAQADCRRILLVITLGLLRDWTAFSSAVDAFI